MAMQHCVRCTIEQLPISDPYLRDLVGPVCVHAAHGLVLQNPAAVPVHFLIRSLAAMCSDAVAGFEFG